MSGDQKSRRSMDLGGIPRKFWGLLKRTGVEAAPGRDPQFLSWFFGVPLVSWFVTALSVAGLVWKADEAAVPVLILGVAILNVAATSRVLFVQGETLNTLLAQLGNQSDEPPPIGTIHDAWRARSATWGYLAGLIALSFLAGVRFLPSWALGDLFPPALLPLYEIVVLALTVAMIAVLSQYTSRTAAADARATSRDLRRLSSEIMTQSERTAAQLTADLGALTTRLSESLAQTSRETNTVLAELTNSVRDLAVSAAAQTELVRNAQAATEEALRRAAAASETQADAVHDLARRRAEELSAEVDRLRPIVSLRMRVEGVLFHHIWLDLYDSASQAVGVVVGVQSGVIARAFPIGNLSTRIPRPLDLGDVTQFPLDGIINVTLQFSDLAGRQYRGRRDFHFTRELSILRTTTGWQVDPPGWTLVDSQLDIPVEANVPALGRGPTRRGRPPSRP
jgi:hypothetical protein